MNTKILKDLNFAEKINGVEAVTEAGKEMLKNYRAHCYSNAATCGLVNGFVAEAKKFSFDTGLVSIVESVLSFIKENNISWKLASACESIENNPSTYNYIAKVGVEQVEKLLEMNESDVISYIKAGVLKNIQYIPEFRAICKEVYKSTINEVQGTTYNVTNPISYVTVENNVQSFSVLGKAYQISEGNVSEATIQDVTFNRINMLLESFKSNGESIEYTWNEGKVNECKFSINENGLTFTKGEVVESFDNKLAYMEYCDTISRILPMHEKMNFMQVTSAIGEVFECMDNIVVLDKVNIINTNNGTIAAIIESENNVNLTVFRSVNAGTSCTNFDYVVEALNQVNKISGVDLKFLYENRINEDVKKQNPDEYKEIKEALEAQKEAAMDMRKKKIALLAEKYKNDPAKIALLNSTARQLAILESEK